MWDNIFVSKTILIVEDDKDLQKVISDFLKAEGFLAETASTGSEALAKITKVVPDLVLLDLGLPDIQGETVLKNIRFEHSSLPIVILTAKAKPAEIAQGLNLGADDYLPKPFAAEELLARINARLKKDGSRADYLKTADLVLDLTTMAAKRGHRRIDLTKTEFELLKYLMENNGRVVTREMILNHVWGYSPEVESRVVDVYIGYLRKKVDFAFAKKLIKNRRGFGYQII